MSFSTSSTSSESLEVRSPGDGARVGEVPLHGREDVLEAVSRCRTVQSGWASLAVSDRLRRLEALHAALGSRAEEIASTVVDETGKPWIEAMTEVVTVLGLLRFYLRKAPGVLEPRAVRTAPLKGRKARVEREPYGVIGVISPWNYPFLLAMEPVVTALVCGNGAVLKPSEHTPLSGSRAEELADEAGLPDGLVRVVNGDGRTGDALVTSGVDKVVFTGSASTGRRVMAAAAEVPTPVVLELGGKDPALVLEDADLDQAAEGVVFGGLYNAGQTCVATERIFVVDSIHDAFVERVVERVRKLRLSTGEDRDVGPMTTPEQMRVVEDHVVDAVEKGARVLVGGDRTDPASNLYRPTVLVEVDESMRVMTEETFGPVLPIRRVRDAEEAVERANDTGYGLFASVWTGDTARGEDVAGRLQAGGVSVNDTLSHYSVPGLPAGGVKESGFGRMRGLEGLRELTRTRSVVVNSVGGGGGPLRFPYGRRGRRVLRSLVAFRREGGVRGLLRAVGAWFGGGS